MLQVAKVRFVRRSSESLRCVFSFLLQFVEFGEGLKGGEGVYVQFLQFLKERRFLSKKGQLGG